MKRAGLEGRLMTFSTNIQLVGVGLRPKQKRKGVKGGGSEQEWNFVLEKGIHSH